MNPLLADKNSNRKTLLLVALLFLILDEENMSLPFVDAKSKVYIAYMGKRQHNEDKFLTETHHEMLAGILGSREASENSMIYTYKYGFSGFAAKMTESQAQMVSELPGVAQVIPNRLYKLQTTRSWDYLHLSPHFSTSLLQKSNMGEGVVIGLLDTGISPEKEFFNDEGLGPIPSGWKGFCASGEQFDGAQLCNRKVIGARYFVDGLLASYGMPLNTTEIHDYFSPRDCLGHGTKTSFVAGGSFMANVSYRGFGLGTARGGAPKARLAMYKVCWNLYGGVCSSVDIMKAFDEAIHDGVDVLSVSIASDIPAFSYVDKHDGISIGSFHAAAMGITVVSAAGNHGPNSDTVLNTAPWILTVAATTLDRSFPTEITLGNKKTIMGQAMFTGKDKKFRGLVYPEVQDPDVLFPRYCKSLLANDTWMAGNVVLCFTLDNQGDTYDAASSIKKAGGLGLIVSQNPIDFSYSCPEHFPCVQVSYEIGHKILEYIRSSRNPRVRLGHSRTYIGRPIPTKVAVFSSRGPNPVAPSILKPDIAAPGSCILLPITPQNPNKKITFAFESGTSFATPHVAAIAALLKSLHPGWSPAAIKSAIMTTAWTTDPWGEPILAEGNPTKLADPFDYGSGIINPNHAARPGLIYNMNTLDYIHSLCGMRYNDVAISKVVEQPTLCPHQSPSILDINLPSITLPNLRNSTTVTRTVTNVGDVNAIYKAFIEPPRGIRVVVQPDRLTFNSTTKIATFKVTISTSYLRTTDYCFGALTWTDGMHMVRSPIAVRTEMIESFDHSLY